MQNHKKLIRYLSANQTEAFDEGCDWRGNHAIAIARTAHSLKGHFTSVSRSAAWSARLSSLRNPDGLRITINLEGQLLNGFSAARVDSSAE
jgi:hypothetical protein